jgi:hypothetical protein
LQLIVCALRVCKIREKSRKERIKDADTKEYRAVVVVAYMKVYCPPILIRVVRPSAVFVYVPR